MKEDARYHCYLPRPLTPKEFDLTRWIIEHGDVSKAEQELYLTQLEHAKVVRRCACGCASVDFAIDGVEPAEKPGLRIIGDFLCGPEERMSGVFVFSKGGALAGIEIYQLSDATVRSELPEPAELAPIRKLNA